MYFLCFCALVVKVFKGEKVFQVLCNKISLSFSVNSVVKKFLHCDLCSSHFFISATILDQFVSTKPVKFIRPIRVQGETNQTLIRNREFLKKFESISMAKSSQKSEVEHTLLYIISQIKSKFGQMTKYPKNNFINIK